MFKVCRERFHGLNVHATYCPSHLRFLLYIYLKSFTLYSIYDRSWSIIRAIAKCDRLIVKTAMDIAYATIKQEKLATRGKIYLACTILVLPLSQL